MPALPTGTVMTTNAAGERKPRKLRASCDACSRAKVRCDKVRPTCHRCGNMSICCNYSPSMRLGKPRKNRNPDGSIMRGSSPATRRAFHPPPRSETFPPTAPYANESSPEPTEAFFLAPPTPEYHYPDAFMASRLERNRSPYSESGSFVSGWSNEDQLMLQTSAEAFAPPAPLPVPMFPGHGRTTSMNSQSAIFTPVDTLAPSPLLPSPQFLAAPEQSIPLFPQQKLVSPQPMMPAPLPTPPSSALTMTHNCTEFSLQTMSSVYAPPVTQPLVGESDATSHLPTLESVMTTNKAAVDKLFVLLGCPCTENPHFCTTIAFTITKVLEWYQAIAVTNQPSSDSAVRTPMESFRHTSLSTLTQEGDEETVARTQHILGELRRLEKLIHKFKERYCTPQNVTNNCSIYGDLESMLRIRVRDTFKITMKTAPEEIKRQVAARTFNSAQQQQQQRRTMTL
ncbi:hypothetical protein M011DRAFT_494021 [Sporormia fimetaria CBS 119925]|uniref:Zn(2)-C6 fungal-type domain-containing protein n=1 Tax=Sporormia fimetaria CBS 119925 TaxID=1340428 RepID=A0A6A6VEA0_9PLEO|nr:hypothetical protein M011DRAFT_494021 [Sporormia fimetaria CBS 119925]